LRLAAERRPCCLFFGEARGKQRETKGLRGDDWCQCNHRVPIRCVARGEGPVGCRSGEKRREGEAPIIG
jgi:hypothetical protein